jgi:isocitrate/isopropylmalate dehydrogenase
MKKVVVIEGDDASPEAMRPSVELIDSLDVDVEWTYPAVGEEAIQSSGHPFPDETKAVIDASDTTFFGATSGSSTAALFYLRWGKETYANVRPCRYLTGANTPLHNPTGIDFVIVRENLEDLYMGLEGPLEDLKSLNLTSRTARKPVNELGEGRYAVKIITAAATRRVVEFAFELARQRDGLRKVTCTTKYNMLPGSDGYFRDIATEIAGNYPDIEFETFIIDDFACRMLTHPHSLDVVVMPNLYGDIMSDSAAGLVGGLGQAASGCFGDRYAYFESAHGTAPDVAGQNIINPTATLLSGCMMLQYLGYDKAAAKLDTAIQETYRGGTILTPDQGGVATTAQFCEAVSDRLFS